MSVSASHTTNSKHQADDHFAIIYYGDSEVDAGDPFVITCRIRVDDPVQWVKDNVLLHSTRRHRSKEDYVFSAVQAEGASPGAIR